MSVHLVARGHSARPQDFDGLVAIGQVSHPLGALPVEVTTELEEAFSHITDDFLALARSLGRSPSAVFAHAPSATVVASDLGEAMAWVGLVKRWAASPRRWLIICEDPWLFRQLATISGVSVIGCPPRLWLLRSILAVRGFVARLAFSIQAAWWAAASRPVTPLGGVWLLSYGQETANGEDAYFGSLMTQLPGLNRALHVDCPPGRAARLLVSSGPGSGFSLHAWGSPVAALLRLPFACWRPCRNDRAGPWGWLVRRAAALEGGTGQGAAILWQILCQRKWLAATRPTVIVWPWECHGWERDLAASARAAGIHTVGTQHSTIGRFELNHHLGAHSAGVAALPDTIVCVGELFRRHLEDWGIPADRLRMAGALRYPAVTGPCHDVTAPVFVALPSHKAIAGQMVAAVTRIARATGRKFLVRDHPMYPISFVEDEWVRRAQGGLNSQQSVSAVVYAATTVGLEAVLLGLPTLRYIPQGCVALNILPNNVTVPTANSEELVAALDNLTPPPPLCRTEVFGPVDLAVWRDVLNPEPMLKSL